MSNSKKNIVVVGAGISGLEASRNLAELGYTVDLIEKTDKVGGHVKDWHKTFPYIEDSNQIISYVSQALTNENVKLHDSTEISYVENTAGVFKLKSKKNKNFSADAVLISNGFNLFDAHKKEEYGYGIFENVISNSDLESYFKTPSKFKNKEKLKFGFIHCVGSRDAKVNNVYCSKVCCATAVKQAIEVKLLFPDSEVYCFYMDLRMYGKHFEELFYQAQEKHGIHFVRARLSEVNQNFDTTLQIKIEDTLTSRPMKLSLDYIILMSGMSKAVDTAHIADLFKLDCDEYGFLKPAEYIINENKTNSEGVFVCGANTGPKTITDCLNDARSAALSIHKYLDKN